MLVKPVLRGIPGRRSWIREPGHGFDDEPGSQREQQQPGADSPRRHGPPEAAQDMPWSRPSFRALAIATRAALPSSLSPDHGLSSRFGTAQQPGHPGTSRLPRIGGHLPDHYGLTAPASAASLFSMGPPLAAIRVTPSLGPAGPRLVHPAPASTTSPSAAI